MARFGHVVAGGVVAGTLDLVYICGLYLAWKSVAPLWILQSIAAGWIGRDAAHAGAAATALLGLATHYAIAIAMAFAYFAVALRAPVLVQKPFFYGSLYGVVLYALMTYVVVPLSAAGTGAFPPWQWLQIAHLAAHVFLVALPCAWAARRALR